ncbi:phosphoribosylglycinamide formyltransferase [Pseudoduganella umbonata]|uniref:Phosphoribosylglycinamide formyltransferase n=1 Tax=Pseudoduganella umbonata TaxID=864828 RepID=A0A4P8HP91_9BURK|nr:phosphoribosylglycinamide formyltransferase [Pseudoduganella umbonata]MBB3225000.1 phosphoribosylglycinamide formyltransferase-1 [Pseudoduganella umbonata]QCP11519.1 phosphoribosylglycinamide formyltransferase [Pseudoduganella umbonata]
MKNIVILISGRGSNMEAVVRAAEAEQWPARIAAVISNRADAKGLEFAAARGIPTAVVPNKEYPTREAFDAALQAVIDRFAPDLVVLAGFMRILTPGFVEHYSGRMLNIHPSLLPLFPGLHTHEAALAAGHAEHGATVHFVTAELDHGPMVDQVSVPVLPGDTADTLAQRLLVQEHVLYPRAIRWFIEDKLIVENGQVYGPHRPRDSAAPATSAN